MVRLFSALMALVLFASAASAANKVESSALLSAYTLVSGDTNGSPIDLSQVDAATVHVVWAAANQTDGVVQLQVSNEAVPTSGGWTDLATYKVDLGAAAGNGLIDILLKYRWARLHVESGTNTTGTVTATLFTKEAS